VLAYTLAGVALALRVGILDRTLRDDDKIRPAAVRLAVQLPFKHAFTAATPALAP